MSTRCRSCGAEIFWAVTASGRRMPLDTQPSPSGTMVLRTQAGDGGTEALDEPMLALSVAAARALEANGVPPRPDEPRFISHFATCPQAAQHRKRATP